ncbi:MAG: hypothetical protein AMXMBFR56_41810 [Polyangiaceae bacterium]
MNSRRVLTAVAVLCLAGTAGAEVLREGNWPADEPKVSLSVKELPRAEAVKRLAQKAGWSVVIESPPSAPVDVEVKDQPADKVLELLLSDARYVAKRDGKLISIARAADAPAPEPTVTAMAEPAPAPSAAAAPAPSQAPPAAKVEVDESKAEDRVVTGGSTRVEAGEVVHDLVVMGGSAEVHGVVTGDVSVMGGSVVVKKGARVKGDVSVVGGSFDAEDGAEVEGKVDVVGGKARRGDGNIGIQLGRGDRDKRPTFVDRVSDFGGSVTRTALLFVFGTVLLALATGRMDAMQGEVAARPMRTFALGIVGSLVAALAFLALCVTVIGIPIAIVALLLGVIGAYAGICATLTTVGAALAHHKSKSPYVHLAVGCVVFLIASWLPWIGGFVTAGVVLVGIGALIATRGAGFFPKKVKNEGPYRTAAA